MAGPTATILFPNEPTPTQIGEIGQIIHSISENAVGDDFWVTTTRPIGGNREFAGRPFCSSGGDVYNPLRCVYTENELVQLGDILGSPPTTWLTIAAMCNDPLDHEILARLCSQIARKLNGIVDLHGTIAVETAPHLGLYEIDFKNHMYQLVSRHICRSNFLDSFVSHPDFRMVK